MKKYRTIKKHLTLEEKKKRLALAEELGEIIYDEEEFLNQDIFTEYVLMKCDKCDYEETIELDFILEMESMHEGDYLQLECPQCNKQDASMIPINVYEEKFKNKK